MGREIAGEKIICLYGFNCYLYNCRYICNSAIFVFYYIKIEEGIRVRDGRKILRNKLIHFKAMSNPALFMKINENIVHFGTISIEL